MNREKILNMIRHYVKDNQLTYYDFNKIFYVLDNDDKYLVVRFIEENLNIALVDEIASLSETEKENAEYVSALTKPYVQNNQLTYDEFDEIFSDFEKKMQYQITDILAYLNIEIVDEKILSVEKNSDRELLIPRKAHEIKLSNKFTYWLDSKK